jgi:hypothetical protein
MQFHIVSDDLLLLYPKKKVCARREIKIKILLTRRKTSTEYFLPLHLYVIDAAALLALLHQKKNSTIKSK